MQEMLKGKARAELVEMIEQLSMECDERHAHEDALEEQIRALGAEPVRHTFLDPPIEGMLEGPVQVPSAIAE